MNIFTYGSLMFPRVWSAVVRGTYANTGARLYGYQRRKIKGETYPALIPGDRNDAVDGIIYLDVDRIDGDRLDQFEGTYYERKTETFTLPDNRPISAYIYIFKQEFRAMVAEESWDPEWFARVGIQRFMVAYAGYRWIDPTTDPGQKI